MNKRYFLTALAFTTFAMANAQNKAAAPAKQATPAKPAIKASEPFSLKSAQDSLSYALGILEASFFKQQGIDAISYNALNQGMKDVLTNNLAALMTPDVANNILREKLQAAAAKKAQAVVDAGLAFLEENKKRPEVKVTPSGLQYEILKQGTGALPKDTNEVRVHYTGTLLNGEKFDSSRDRDQPAEFPLTAVIRGWTEGLQLMPVGSQFKFYIPYELAYGIQGRPPQIPGGSVLVFDIELLDIVK